jgi:TatA/E family protein of Tat protein translocase
MFGIGTTELLVILLIILLVFGSKKLPELAQGLGKSLKEFKRATNDIQDELDINAPLKSSPAPQKQKKADNIEEDSAKNEYDSEKNAEAHKDKEPKNTK